MRMCCTGAVPLLSLDELCLFKAQVVKLVVLSMQADQIHLIALKVQRKYYSEPSRDSQRWTSRHDQLLKADKGLPKQELPATMLSMDYTRVWYTDRSATHPPCEFSGYVTLNSERSL